MPVRTITEDDELRHRQQFAAAIRVSRLERGETQEETAQKIGVSWGVYRNWEKGRAMPRGLAYTLLCQHFGWPVVDAEAIGHNRPSSQSWIYQQECDETPPMVSDYPEREKVSA